MRVAEAVAEGEERIDLLLVEPAVADVDAFAVGGLAVDALHGALGMLGVGGGVVVEALAPGDGQAAGGADLAGEQIGCGPAAFIAGPPHFEDRLDLVDPGQGDGLAGVEYDDGVGIDGGDFFDELVLLAGQAEDGVRRVQTKTTATLAFLAAAMAASWSALRCSGVYQLRRTCTGAVEVSGLMLISIACGPAVSSMARRTLSRPSVVGTTLSWLACRMSPWTPPWKAPVPAEPLAVDGDVGVGAEGLEIDPVGAGVGGVSVPFQVTVELGGESVAAAGEVELRRRFASAPARALQAGLAVVGERHWRESVVPVMSSSTANWILALPVIFLRASMGPIWRWGRPTDARRWCRSNPPGRQWDR